MKQMPLPFPSLTRIIPAIYAYWNSVKGGSDTTTKLMDDCKVKIPKSHMNGKTVAIARLLMLEMVLIHRLLQVKTSHKKLDDYPSLQHYRDAASARLTFHSSLLKIASSSEQKAVRFAAARTVTVPTSQPSVVTPPSSPVATGNVIDGVLPQKVTFGATLPTRTPLKLGKRLLTKKATKEEIAMAESCCGMPVQLYPIKSNKRCDHCHDKKTSWYCLGCKRWLCMSQTTRSGAPKKMYEHQVQGKKMHFTKSCFQTIHENTWKTVNDDTGK